MNNIPKKYKYISKYGDATILKSYTSDRGFKLSLILAMESKSFYRLWFEKTNEPVTTQDFPLTKEGLEKGVAEYNKSFENLTKNYTMHPYTDIVHLELNRYENIKPVKKAGKRFENNKQKLKEIIKKLKLTTDEVVSLME